MSSRKTNPRLRRTTLRQAVLETLESRQLLTGTSFYPTPFGANQLIPAAAYDTNGEGSSYHDTTPGNSGNDQSFRPNTNVDISTGGTIGHVVSFTQTGEYLVYSLVVPTTGSYAVQSSSANTAMGGLFHVEFNGANLTGDFSNYDTGSFSKYQTQQSASFQLNAGTYKMKVVVDSVASNGAGGNLNWFTVIPTPPAASGTEVPYSAVPGSGVNIPFANYDKGGEGVAYHDTTTLNTGNSSFRNNTSVDISSGGTSGNVVGFTAPTEYLNYTINLPSGGTYKLQVSAANPASGGVFHLSQNGVNLTGSVAVGPTASFTAYAIDTSPVFKLPAGKQVVRLAFDKTATNGAVGNFDYFKLVPSAAAADAPFTSPFVVNQTIAAANFDKGGQGVAYNDTTPSNLGNDNYRSGEAVDLKTGGTTGHLVAYTAAGEWLNYTVKITTAGNYKLEASAANPASGATFHVDESGVKLGGEVAVKPTSAFTAFSLDTTGSFALSAGTHILRVFFDTAASNGAVGNFDYFKLVAG